MQLGGSDCSYEQQRWIWPCKSLLGVARRGRGQRVMQLYPFACPLQRIPCADHAHVHVGRCAYEIGQHDAVGMPGS